MANINLYNFNWDHHIRHVQLSVETYNCNIFQFFQSYRNHERHRIRFSLVQLSIKLRTDITQVVLFASHVSKGNLTSCHLVQNCVQFIKGWIDFARNNVRPLQKWGLNTGSSIKMNCRIIPINKQSKRKTIFK